MKLLPHVASPSRPYWRLIDPADAVFPCPNCGGLGRCWLCQSTGSIYASDVLRELIEPERYYGLQEQPGDSCCWQLWDATTDKPVIS